MQIQQRQPVRIDNFAYTTGCPKKTQKLWKIRMFSFMVKQHNLSLRNTNICKICKPSRQYFRYSTTFRHETPFCYSTYPGIPFVSVLQDFVP